MPSLKNQRINFLNFFEKFSESQESRLYMKSNMGKFIEVFNI